MRRRFVLVPVAIVVFLLAWSPENKTMGSRQTRYGIGTADTVRDSVVFYDADIKARQKNYKKELLGKWNMISMRRQQKAGLEILNNVSIEFKIDMSFSGKAPCNSISGIYTLKGTSIKFSNIMLNSKMACANPDLEQAFLQLLEGTVSAYSVSDTKLLLRDGSSNIIFELEREN